MSFIKEQVGREVKAAKSLWRAFLWVLVFFWGAIGVAMLATAAWMVGVVFIAGAGYLGYRLWSKKQVRDIGAPTTGI